MEEINKKGIKVEDCVPQFKVGDTVVITIPKEYNIDTHVPFDLNKEMIGLNGTCTKIIQIVKDRYKKSEFPKIDNLDGCKYYLENNSWIWPNCLLTKVHCFDYDLAKKILSPYQSMEQEAITSLTSSTGLTSLTSLTSGCIVDECSSICGTYTVKEAIQENKDLITIKSKKLKLNFKN